jgi:hypothetical protein
MEETHRIETTFWDPNSRPFYTRNFQIAMLPSSAEAAHLNSTYFSCNQVLTDQINLATSHFYVTQLNGHIHSFF